VPPTKITKKPVTVEAVQWDGTAAGIADVHEAFPEAQVSGHDIGIPDAHIEVYDKLHDSWVKVLPGQWIIKGVQGEYYPCADDVLRATYSIEGDDSDVIDAEVIE
jgi:hypothetical protein